MSRRLLALATSLFLHAACAVAQPAPPLPVSSEVRPQTVAPLAPPEPVEPTQVMAMPEELRARVHADFLSSGMSSHRRLQQLVEFMFDVDGLGVVYREILTFGALDLLQLTAKLNSRGYCIDQPKGDLRARKYVRVFKAG